MGLSSSDKLPVGIEPADAYRAIRGWYRKNAKLALARKDDYGRAAAALIKALPPNCSPVEMKAVFVEVIMGLLEFAYHEDDGKYKMAAYAHSALKSLGTDFQLTPTNKSALQSSVFFDKLSVIHR